MSFGLLTFLFDMKIWTFIAIGFIALAVIGLIIFFAVIGARKKALAGVDNAAREWKAGAKDRKANAERQEEKRRQREQERELKLFTKSHAGLRTQSFLSAMRRLYDICSGKASLG